MEFDLINSLIDIYEICDNAWKAEEESHYEKRLLDTFFVNASKDNYNNAEILVNQCALSLSVNGEIICKGKKILTETRQFTPLKNTLMNIGICQGNDTAYYKNIKITDTKHNHVLHEWDFTKITPVFGTVKDGILAVNNCFELLNPTPSVNVLRKVHISKEVKSARLYATAFGFYNAYINGQKVGNYYYTPGFTDYRKRVQYQSYDITGMLKAGENIIGATISKGYYSGFCSYIGPMVYGTQNYFMVTSKNS